MVAIYSTFLQRAFDQILHDVCLPNLPVVFAVDRAGIVGEDGKTHQGVFDIGYFGLMPNMTLLAPRDAGALARMLRDAPSLGGPVAIRYPRSAAAYTESVIGDITVPEVVRQGCDVVMVAVGSMVGPALEAAGIVGEWGISAGVIDPKVAAPVNCRAILELARGVRHFVTVEEHVVANGFGQSFASSLKVSGVSHARVHILALPSQFIPHGDRSAVLASHGLNAGGIAEACRELVNGDASGQAVAIEVTSNPQ